MTQIYYHRNSVDEGTAHRPSGNILYPCGTSQRCFSHDSVTYQGIKEVDMVINTVVLLIEASNTHTALHEVHIEVKMGTLLMVVLEDDVSKMVTFTIHMDKMVEIEDIIVPLLW